MQSASPTPRRLQRLLWSVSAFILVLPFAAKAQESDPAVSGILDLPVLSIIANRTPTDTREVGSAVTIIDREELERRQIRVVSDALRSVPGVAVGRSGGVGNLTEVRLRGSEANQTLVLIDGIEINDPSLGDSVDFANLLSLDVERIEVLRGPQSALYGSDAIGGVVNIITRRGEGPAKVVASLEGGNRGTLAGSASVGGGGDNYDYFVGGGGFRTDGFSSAAEWRGNTEKDGYANGTGFAKFGFNPTDNLRLDLVGRMTNFWSESDDYWGGVGAVDGDLASTGKQLFGKAQATLDLFEGRWQQIFGVSGSRQQTDYYYFGLPSGSYDGDKTRLDYQSNIFLTSDAFDASHVITVALEREEETALLAGYTDFNRAVGQTGIVGQYRLGLWNDLFLTGSVRRDINDMFGDVTTWRATGAWTIDRTGTKLRASSGTGIKNPTLFELFGTSPDFEPNPDLRPERAIGWDVGFDQEIFEGRAVFDATYFDQRITDLIQNIAIPDDKLSVENLAGVSVIRGVELGLSANLTDALTMRAAYTWMHGVDSDGAPLTRRPTATASLDLNYGFLGGRASLNLGVVYTGEQKDTAYAFDYTPIIVDLPAYWLFNLAGSFKVDDRTELYARVENLFDTDYEDVYTYGGTGRLCIGGVKRTF